MDNACPHGPMGIFASISLVVIGILYGCHIIDIDTFYPLATFASAVFSYSIISLCIMWRITRHERTHVTPESTQSTPPPELRQPPQLQYIIVPRDRWVTPIDIIQPSGTLGPPIPLEPSGTSGTLETSDTTIATATTKEVLIEACDDVVIGKHYNELVIIVQP